MTSLHFYIDLKIARISIFHHSNVINYDMNLNFVERKRIKKRNKMKRVRELQTFCETTTSENHVAHQK